MKSLTDLSAELFQVLFHAAWMSTFLLIGVWLFLKLTRSSSAAFRSAVWNRVLVGVILLPILLCTFPGSWKLNRAISASKVLPSGQVPNTLATPNDGESKAQAGSEIESRDIFSKAVALGQTFDWTPFSQVIAGVWLLGVAFCLLRIGAGHVILYSRSKASASNVESGWLTAAGEAASRLNLEAEVDLVERNDTVEPAIWGLRRPKVFLPAGVSWSLDRKRVILLHEFAHLKRFDTRSIWIQQLVAAIYWFHPGVLFAVAEARNACEQACDDLVLRAGVQPVDYASHLFELSQMLLPAKAPIPVMGFLGSQALESRLIAILNPQVNRKTPGTLVKYAAAIALSLPLLGMAAIAPLISTSRSSATSEQASNHLTVRSTVGTSADLFGNQATSRQQPFSDASSPKMEGIPNPKPAPHPHPASVPSSPQPSSQSPHPTPHPSEELASVDTPNSFSQDANVRPNPRPNLSSPVPHPHPDPRPE